MQDIPSAQMLNAIELFHYASKFRDSKFLILLSEKTDFYDIADDIRTLIAANINFSIASTANKSLKNCIEKMKYRGLELEYVEIESEKEILSNQKLKHISKPCVFSLSKKELELVNSGISIANTWGAKRILFLSEKNGIQLKGKNKSHLTFKELEKIINSDLNTSLDLSLLTLIHRACVEHSLEFSILESKKGNIFKELFTHIGSGTLISADYSSVIRQAKNPDILNIYRLLRPNLGSGSIIEIDEDYISNNINSFYVYSINDSIVAAAMLKEFDSHNELAKFSTLPRYQGKGKARILAEYIIKESKNAHKKSVFSLSTVSTMWRLFQSLGMKEVDRETLPEDWQKNYDFSRPSKAFQTFFE